MEKGIVSVLPKNNSKRLIISHIKMQLLCFYKWLWIKSIVSFLIYTCFIYNCQKLFSAYTEL